MLRAYHRDARRGCRAAAPSADARARCGVQGDPQRPSAARSEVIRRSRAYVAPTFRLGARRGDLRRRCRSVGWRTRSCASSRGASEAVDLNVLVYGRDLDTSPPCRCGWIEPCRPRRPLGSRPRGDRLIRLTTSLHQTHPLDITERRSFAAGICGPTAPAYAPLGPAHRAAHADGGRETSSPTPTSPRCRSSTAAAVLVRPRLGRLSGVLDRAERRRGLTMGTPGWPWR